MIMNDVNDVNTDLDLKNFKIDIPITVTDNSGKITVINFGLHPDATDGIDSKLGEMSLPPNPPLGAFEARFVNVPGVNLGLGSYKDFRYGTPTSIFYGKKFKFVVQKSAGATSTSIQFGTFPPGVSGVMSVGGFPAFPIPTGVHTLPGSSSVYEIELTLDFILGESLNINNQSEQLIFSDTLVNSLQGDGTVYTPSTPFTPNIPITGGDSSILNNPGTSLSPIPLSPLIGYKITGIIKAGRGAPIKGASVILDNYIKELETFAGGNYIFTDVLPGQHTIYIAAEGYANQSITVTILDQDIIQNVEMLSSNEPFCNILGNVKNNSGVSVVARVKTFPPSKLNIICDHSGRYEIKNIQPGTYKVIAENDDYSTGVSDSFSISAGETKVIPLILKGKVFANLSGYVYTIDPLTQNNVKLANANITITSLTRNYKKSYNTQNDGEYEFDAIEQDLYKIKVQYLGRYKTYILESLDVTGNTELNIQLEPERFGSIGGVVYNDVNTPYSGADIFLNSLENENHFRATSEVDGTYDIESIPEGVYKITVKPHNTLPAGGYKTIIIPSFEIKAFVLTTKNFNLELIQYGRIVGTVQGVYDTANLKYPLRGVDIVAESSDGANETVSTKTDNTSQYEFSYITTGIYNLIADVSGYEYKKIENVVVEQGERIEINFQLKENETELTTPTYVDLKRLYDEESPNISTILDYKKIIESTGNIIENNKIIINKINDIIPMFILYKKVRYNITNLYSNKQFKVNIDENTSIDYVGSYYYDYKTSSFLSGKSDKDDKPINVGLNKINPNTKLTYIKKQHIEDIFKTDNFDFSSILREQQLGIENNYSLFRTAVNSIALNLNKKLSFLVGTENALFRYYSGFKEIIKSNLKYFRNYNEVKRFSVSKYIKDIKFNDVYADFIDQVVVFHTQNDNNTILINESLGITVTTPTPYSEFIKMVNCPAAEPSVITDPNYKVIKAFYNMNYKLSEFLKDFEYMDSVQRKNEYYAFLLTSVDLNINETLNETYNGLAYLQEKLTKYVLDKIKDPEASGITNLMIRNDASKTALTDIMLKLSKLLEVIKDLKSLFDTNSSYNIYIDFDMRDSGTLRNSLMADNMNVYQLVDKYKKVKATTYRVATSLDLLNYVKPQIPFISSFYYTARPEAVGTLKIQLVATFTIPVATTKNVHIQTINIKSHAQSSQNTPTEPTPEGVNEAKWWWDKTSNTWTWSTVERAFAYTDGKMYTSQLSYDWEDKDGNIKSEYIELTKAYNE